MTNEHHCTFCNESKMNVGEKTEYGSIIIYKIGNNHNGWFATLSPRTGGNPEKNFTVQLMTLSHLTHFSEIFKNKELAKNYGIALAKIYNAVTEIIKEDPFFELDAKTREKGIALAVYGKCTTWEKKKEHLHFKVFQFQDSLGQPFTVDSSFGRKKVFVDPVSQEKFIKMTPVIKKPIREKRLQYLSKRLIELLN